MSTRFDRFTCLILPFSGRSVSNRISHGLAAAQLMLQPAPSAVLLVKVEISLAEVMVQRMIYATFSSHNRCTKLSKSFPGTACKMQAQVSLGIQLLISSIQI